MIRTAALLCTAVVLAIAAALRVRAYRRKRSRAALDLAIGLGSLALAVTVYAPPVYRALDRLVFQRPNTSELAGHLAVVVSAWAAVGMVAGLFARGTAIRRGLGVYATVVALGMCAAFLGQRFPTETTDFTTVYGGQADVRWYWAVFLAYALVLLTTLIVLTARAPVRDQRWLRRGLSVISVGAALGALYLAHWAVDLGFRAAGRTLPARVDGATLVLAVVGSILIGVGTALPTLGPRIRAAIAVRRLYPLWLEVTDRYPEVRSAPDPGDDRLLRLVVEVRDAATEARMRGELDTPTLRQLDALPARDLVDFDAEVRQLEMIARGCALRSASVGAASRPR